MSSFTTSLKGEILDNGNLLITEEFDYYREENNDEVIKVPSGFESDFASVPFLFRIFVSPIGRHSKPAVLHDYLCELYHKGEVSRDFCDEVFNEAMKVKKVSSFHRIILFYGVRTYAFYLKCKNFLRNKI
ncbi:DUF1353 domain-containing protein [Helicobacter cappadocius]|uniref:DUF1353 domain-containing protein n=1 Tax=Helicobacter cappadocius TaxID=3063998 RepID=A0AA90T5R4_9HELI|nr:MULTISPECIES: DUF1353 domain-containing protein [unclassified Helicobacter]MDO7253907.1 DUF1353 domain-containing protein [Helicobacter sp. faydin-H75]MDP2539768.1 DUF1353 domain-containing protein [Helicobacter sp. faydin-H76]